MGFCGVFPLRRLGHRRNRVLRRAGNLSLVGATLVFVPTLAAAAVPPATDARPERRWLLGLEYSRRGPSFPEHEASELSFVHGLLDFADNAGLRIHAGLHFKDGSPFWAVIPLQLSLSVEPRGGTFEPWASLGFGGYLATQQVADAGSAPYWLWALKGRAGMRLNAGETFGDALYLRPYVELAYVQERQAPLRSWIAPGWALGIQLEYLFEVSPASLLRMVTHGIGAPEGW
jgi:hypothetical protein